MSSGPQLRSLLKVDGTLELSLVKFVFPVPRSHEVVVRVEGSPINPSDLGLLLGGADLSSAKASRSAQGPVISAKVPPAMIRAMGVRVDQSLPVGGEGAGAVVEAGDSPEAGHG